MVIGACGFGSTGSSAVSDYLKEYNSFVVLDDLEFTWVSSVDGLIDLERAVMHPHTRTADSITAISRYIKKMKRTAGTYESHGLSAEEFERSTMEFVDAITQLTWNWYDPTDNWTSWFAKHFKSELMVKRVIPKLEITLEKTINCYPMKKVRFSVRPDNYYDAAKKHVNDLLVGMGADLSKTIVLDQPFSGNNPQSCFPFFDDPYAVVVDRDPRDNYVFAKTRLVGRNHFMAVDTVEDFIRYYRALREGQPYRRDDSRVFAIQFEDMVYNYDETTERLRNFLHLPENPNPKSIFDPALSIRNTQTFRRFPQFADDIKVIEKELSDYMFDFSRYPEPDLSGDMFYGKSPLNSGKKQV
jgi:hypothetical protein